MIWRWVGCVFGLALALIGGSVLVTRAFATDTPGCLVFSDPFYNTGLLDLRTGVGLNISTIPKRLQQHSAQASQFIRNFDWSWDQKRVAYSLLNNNTHQIQLFVKPMGASGFNFGTLVQAPLGKRTAPTDLSSDLLDFVWSPDSQWLAYWWQTADQQSFLGIADAAGHVQHIQLIPTQHLNQPSVALHGWSADSSYFALTAGDQATGADVLLLWSAPNLQLIQTIPFAVPLPSLSQFGMTELIGDWSPKGHQFAFWLKDKATNHLQLGLITPGERPIYIHFPDATFPSSATSNNLNGPGWSPEGRYLLAEYNSSNADTSLTQRYQLNLVDTITHVVQPLSSVREPVLGSSVFWSTDGQFLYYMRLNDKSALVRGDMMLFRVAKDRPETLIPGLDMNFFMFVSENIWLFKQPGADTDNYVTVLKDSATTVTFGGFKSNMSLEAMGWNSDWIAFTDVPRTNWVFINTRTGMQKRYYEPNFSDAISGISLRMGWLTGLRLGPPPILKLVDITDGTERDVPLSQYTVGLLPDTTLLSGDGTHIAIASRNQAYPDAAFTVDVITLPNGRVWHIPNVAPIYNSPFETLTSISFGPCT